MGVRPYPGFRHEIKHGILGVEHVLPAEVFVIPDVFRRPCNCHGPNRKGVTHLCEREGVLADGLVGVSCGFPTSPWREVIELNVFQIADFVEGI